MRRSTFIALHTFASAMVLGLRVADATMIYNDLYLSQFCVRRTALIYDTTNPDIDRRIRIETTPRDLRSCSDFGELDCEIFSDNLAAEAEPELIKSIDAQLRSKTSDLEISLGYRYLNQENSGCTYFETKLRDPRRVREECEDIEPNSDHLELFGVLTLTTVSVMAFALLAGACLLRRSFRNWHLRNMIQRGKAISSPPGS